MKKLNSVYLYKNKKLNNPYVLLLNKTKDGFTARQITLSGALVSKTMTIPLNATLSPIEAKVRVTIELPKSTRDFMRYKNLISRAVEIKSTYQKIKHKDKEEAEWCRREMVRLALSSFDLQNTIEGRRYNFRDFAKSMKFKKYDTFYSWVVKHLTKQYGEAQYKRIKECADITLIRVIRNYNEHLPCYIGQNKEIDKLIKGHQRTYISEAVRRGLKIYE